MDKPVSYIVVSYNKWHLIVISSEHLTRLKNG